MGMTHLIPERCITVSKPAPRPGRTYNLLLLLSFSKTSSETLSCVTFPFANR